MTTYFDYSTLTSDEDLFIPTQNYNSDDDRFLDSFAADGISTEETSSKENDQHSEDDRDTPSPIPAVNQPSSKKSKRKKKGKTAKPKDADLELLDALIAQNAKLVQPPVVAKVTPPKASTGPKKKLKDILREKREAANSTMAKKIDHAIKTRDSQPEKVAKFVADKRAKESETGDKSKMIKITRETLERFKRATTAKTDTVKAYAQVGDKKFPINTNVYSCDKTEYLLSKYEDRVANGEMTIEEAIAKATAGRDSDDEEQPLMEDDDPWTKLLNREQIVNLLLEKNDEADMARGPEFAAIKRDMGKLFTNITMEMVDHCLNSNTYIDTMVKLHDFEFGMTDSDLNYVAWKSMCEVVYSRYSSKVIMHKGVPITNPVRFYEEVLKQYIAQSMINSITDMDKAGVFERYDPKVRPMAVTCFQRHIADLFPKSEIVVDMTKLIDNGFAPKDLGKLDIFNRPLVAYGIFWSFAFNFNLLGAFFRADDGGYNYYWITYDRINDDIDNIVGLPRKLIKETPSVDQQVVEGSNEESQKLPANSDVKISMRYKEIEADIDEFKEKLPTDDIADISVKSRPGEKRRICINFKEGVSEDDKMSLVDYVTSIVRE